MKLVNLVNEGKFFSGRSHARAVVVKNFTDSYIDISIVINFEGVDSFSQSFISEFFVALKEQNINFAVIQLKGFKDLILEKRAYKEFERIRNLPGRPV